MEINQKIRELFQSQLGSNIDLRRQNNILIACRENDIADDFESNPIVLLPCDRYLYMGSPVCNRSAKIITRAEIEACSAGKLISGTEYLADTQCIIIFPEPRCYFEEGYFEKVDDFYQYAKFADRYLMNLPYICSKFEKMIWLLAIKERQKDLWRANSILLTNIEQKAFDVPKFPAAAAAGGILNAAYPVSMAAAPKYVTMNPVSAKEFLSKEEFADLINLLLRSRADDFVAKLVAILGSSIEYCDVIFANEEVIRLTSKLPSFHSSTFFAFRVFYLEELSMLNRKRGPGRFIMDIDTAAALPPILGKVEYNPYLSTVLRTTMYAGLVLPSRFEGVRGLYSTKDFIARSEIYTQGMLKYIDWAIPGAKTALNGSIMSACAIRSPLERLFRSPDEYFSEYYPTRIKTLRSNIEIDLVPRYDKLFSCHEYTATIADTTTDSDSESTNLDDTAKTEMEIIATAMAAETDDDPAPGPDGIIHDIGYSDIDLMIACDWNLFDSVAKLHFESIKRAILEKDYSANVTMELVETENKHKFIIRGGFRDVDMFHVNDIPSVIIKYHLGCVRAWYDGTAVWCFPSFICAAKTGLNADIRWSSNRKDVRDIVLKVHQRGFGTIINSSDKQNIINYVNNSAQWPHFKIGGLSRWMLRDYLRTALFHEHYIKLFNPSVYRIGIHHFIKSEANPIQVQNLSVNTRSYWQRHSTADDRSLELIFDFRAGTKVILPSDCKSLASYL